MVKSWIYRILITTFSIILSFGWLTACIFNELPLFVSVIPLIISDIAGIYITIKSLKESSDNELFKDQNLDYLANLVVKILVIIHFYDQFIILSVSGLPLYISALYSLKIRVYSKDWA